MKIYIFSLFLFLQITCLFGQNYSLKTLSVEVENKPNTNNSYLEFEKLRLYLIKAKPQFLQSQKYLGKYTPLKKALEQQKIEITEIENFPNDTIRQQRRRINNNNIQQQNNAYRPNNDNPVNTLFLQNKSKDTIYIMSGEIIQGGKQDRVIAQDVVLPPMSEKINVSVFCVEQGRWAYDDTAKEKTFNKYYGGASQKLRSKVEKEKNQQAVWGEVTRSNNENNAKTETQAYTAQLKSKDFQQQHKKYFDFFMPQLETQKDLIGLVVVTGNKVVGCDMFATPALLQGQLPTLMSSYINEAITDGNKITIDSKEVKQYIENLLNEDLNEQEKFLEKKGKKFEHKNTKLRISTF